jgi:hopanoid biosynthesis associated protein HpnK
VQRLLLVTGDDFGASAGVNAAIVHAHREGILTGASLMVAGAAVDEAVDLARDLPTLSMGLHLALCDGRAASPPHTIPDLVDASGRLRSSPLRAGLEDWARRRRLRPQLEREIRTQFERYLSTGLPLDHVDGHHHLHMHPVIFDILFSCLVEYRVPYVRLVREERSARLKRSPMTAEVVPAIFRGLARVYERRLAGVDGLCWPDGVCGLRATGQLDVAWLLEVLPALQATTVELYAHPDRDKVSGRREEAALCSPDVRHAVQDAGYELAGPRALLAQTTTSAGVSLRR